MKQNKIISETKNTYTAIAQEYALKIDAILDHNPWVSILEKKYLKELLLKISSSNPCIMDLGCGNGKDSNFMRIKGANVASVDISRGMLEEAKDRTVNKTGIFIQANMAYLPFTDKTFDAIWANGCIYHVSKKDFIKVLANIRRILAKEGVFLFTFKIGVGEKWEKKPKSYGKFPRFYAFYSIEEMRKALESAGFVEIAIKSYPLKILGETIAVAFAVNP
ncbi:MAG: class I SAM-dependent methyltransferase [Minisyncoccia bacterium]